MAITHAPLVLVMIVPKPIRCFVFSLMFINHIATTKEDATSLQLAPRRTRKLPIHLPPFHYLISPESALLHSKLLLPPKANNAENHHNPPAAMAISSSSVSNSFGDSSSSSSSPSSSPLPASSV